MRMRTKKNLLNLLLGAGVLLLDPLRDRVSDSVVDDLKDRAQDLRDKARDSYEMASDRVSRAERNDIAGIHLDLQYESLLAS